MRGSAPVNPIGPLMLEVRARGGAYVLDDLDREIPGDQFITVERTPHIMNAIRAGDLERRDQTGDSKARKAVDPVATTPVKKPPTLVAKKKKSAKQATKKKRPAKRVAKKRSVPPAPARLRPRARHAGGRPVEHKWESAAQYVDRVTEERKLPRNSEGKPVKGNAVKLMTEWFEKPENDPPAPGPRQIYGWLKKHLRRTQRWWQPEG